MSSWTDVEEQREQLDRTLAEQRTRTLNERFATAAGQLGSDKPPAVRLAGVYAMAGLADDWAENRQTCVDVLCAYLRMPYEPDPGDEAPEPERLAFRASREVRHTVIRVITAHLKDGAAVSWQGLNFDFTGVVFDGGDFAAPSSPAARSASAAPSSPAARSASARRFSGGRSASAAPSSPAARSTSTAPSSPAATVSFDGAEFSGGEVSFDGAEFSGGTVDFGGAEFSGGTVDFRRRVLRRQGRLRRRRVLRRQGQLPRRRFSGGTVDFGAGFSGGKVASRRRFSGGEVPSAAPSSPAARSTSGAGFSGGKVSFVRAEFSGGTVGFDRVPTVASRRFLRRPGRLRRRRVLRGTVSFDGAMFSGGTVTSTAPGSPAARSTSVLLATGHSHPHSPGQTAPRREAPREAKLGIPGIAAEPVLQTPHEGNPTWASAGLWTELGTHSA